MEQGSRWPGIVLPRPPLFPCALKSEFAVEPSRMLPASLARSRAKLRSVCFTLNNYTEEQVEAIKNIECKYLVFGYEVGKQGTKHLQGYLSFSNPMTFTSIKNMLFGAHIEKAKGSPTQNREYCTKDGNYYEKGDVPKPGKRSDLVQFIETVKSGERCKRTLIETHPAVCARYPRFVHECLREFAPPVTAPSIDLYPWQTQVITMIKGDADPRKVYFYVDHKGGSGKTTFARYVLALFQNVQIIRPGKVQDMCYELRTDTRIVIVDVPRCSMEHVQYQFLEYCKDGIVPSFKYESCTKYFDKSMHVLVFCNEDPDMTKLSLDRYYVVNLDMPNVVQ